MNRHSTLYGIVLFSSVVVCQVYIHCLMYKIVMISSQLASIVLISLNSLRSIISLLRQIKPLVLKVGKLYLYKGFFILFKEILCTIHPS